MSGYGRQDTKCPCQDCPERYPACHDKCGKYAEWKAWREKLKQAEQEYRKRFDTMSDESLRKIWRKKRRKTWTRYHRIGDER